MDIVSRASWGAAPPRRTPYRPGYTNEVYLHHSAGAHSGAAGMRSMQRYHQSADPSRDKVPWNDIAYNHVIDPDDVRGGLCTVYEGRGWGVAPGAQKGHNTGTWAVCVMGDFRTKRPTPELLATIAELIRYGHELGHLPLVLTGGHRDAPGQSTTCPGGNLHREIPTIRNLLEEDDMPLSPADLEAMRQKVWFNADMHDYVTGQPLHAATHIRHARRDAFEARVEVAVVRKLIEKMAPASGVAITQADIDAIASEVADELRDRLAG